MRFGSKKYLWYLVCQDGKAIDVIKKPNISYEDVKIELPIKVEGVAVKASSKSEALKLLGIQEATHDDYFEATTDLEELQLLTTAPFVLVESADNIQALSIIMPVLEQYAKLMKTGISIRNWQGNKVAPEPRKDNWLHVWFYTAPVLGKENRIHSAFGYFLDDEQRDAKATSGKGEALTDHTGQVVAEVINKCIYILFDLPHRNTNAAELLTLILEQYYMKYIVPEKDKESRISEFHKQQAQAYSVLYGKFCVNRHKNMIDKHKETKEALDREVERLSKSLIESTRRQYETSILLSALEKMPTPGPEEYVSDLNGLLNDIAVDHILVTSRALFVWTNELQDEDTGKNIGKYLIEVPFNGDKVTAKNTKHPDSRGDWCLGDIHQAMSQLVADYNFAMAALIMIDFLRQNVVKLR